MCCHVMSSLLNHFRFFFFIFHCSILDRDKVHERTTLGVVFVVVHARPRLQSPRSPWTSRRTRCVVHYRRGPHRDHGDRGRRGKAHARTSQSPLFTNKTWTILFSSRGRLLTRHLAHLFCLHIYSLWFRDTSHETWERVVDRPFFVQTLDSNRTSPSFSTHY
jgi:hypothetical protein